MVLPNFTAIQTITAEIFHPKQKCQLTVALEEKADDQSVSGIHSPVIMNFGTEFPIQPIQQLLSSVYDKSSGLIKQPNDQLCHS